MQAEQTSVSVSGSNTKVLLNKPLQLLGAFIFGAMIMYGAAFVQTSAVHNAAHDMRHSQGFPCH